jgi:hypothetical protein
MPSELDKYSKQTNRRLVAGFVFILLVIGDGLIYLFYGMESAIFGLFCIGAGFVPIILIWMTLNIIERIAKRSSVDEIED